MTNNDVPAPLDGPRAPAARRAGGGFPDLRNRRLRAAVNLAAWGAAGVISTTVPALAANPDHVMLYFLFLLGGLLLLLLSMAAADLPWLERAASCLEGLLEDMF